VSAELDESSIAGLVWVEGDFDEFEPTVASIRRAHPDLILYLASPHGSGSLPHGDGVNSLVSQTMRDAIHEISPSCRRHILLVIEPVIVPDALLDRALPALDDDLRVATISFLSNAAGRVSVPDVGRPMLHQVGPHDEISITRRLRSLEPSPRIAPLVVPVGAIVLLSKHALAAVGGFASEAGYSSAFNVTEFGLQASRRGFLNAVDGGTYCTRALDLRPYRPGPLESGDEGERAKLLARHPFARDAGPARPADESPLSHVLSTAAVKIRGLRIAIDGRDIGPKEMGTQVQILSLVRELARRDDVAAIQLGIPGEIPNYALAYIGSPKISLVATPDLEATALAPADIFHRPSQPSSALPIDVWRERFTRVVVTLQDLIAYQVGSYHGSSENWESYRKSLLNGVAAADGVIAISSETQRHIAYESLPIDAERLFLVQNGTDHLIAGEPEEPPDELLARGFLNQEFILVLGTNYGHKNRDIAINGWRTLRHSFPQIVLVLAGAFVPDGSSRIAETRARGQETELYILPDVTSAERNWLVRHARCVVYPTSAEGFGLVPFEAARLGTPTVSVRFGPPRDLNSDAPVWATTWDPGSIASAIGAVLSDPALARAQVRATLNNADQMLWSHTAAGLVRAYRTLLSMPARSNSLR
jgi:glycosyltransferase involved in cell wall biosynthesis